MIAVLGAGLRGGGNLMSDEDVAELTLEGGIAGIARIVIALLQATFAPDMPGEATLPNPAPPQPAQKRQIRRSPFPGNG
jgi:hypothetical protein